jgi:hypothetical protein
MEKNQTKDHIPIFDINTAAYLEMNSIAPELNLQGTRVIFEFPAIDRVFRLLTEYESNPPVPVLDYVNVLRRLRSRMFSMRGA